MGNTNIYCCHHSKNSENELETDPNNHKPKENQKTKITTEVLDNTNIITRQKDISKDPSFTHYTIEPYSLDETNDRKMILSKLVQSTSLLLLKVIKSTILPNGTVLKINPQGLEGSQCGRLDGITYFGSQAEDRTKMDFNFNFQSEGVEENKFMFFQISFNIETSKYYIKDLGSGFGCFSKIESDTILNKNSLFHIGDSYISISIGDEDELNEHMINIKVFNDYDNYVPLNFQPSKSVIRIGRSPDCEVFVNDNHLSKFHCFVEFNSVVGWIIKDGYINKSEDKLEHNPSTNGTWMYLKEDFPIFEGMIFKFMQNLFQCHFEDSQ